MDDIGISGWRDTCRESIKDRDFLKRCRDFIVVENTFRIWEATKAPSKIRVYKLIKEGIDTLRLLYLLEKRYRLKKIGYSGLKDANGLTVQYISVEYMNKLDRAVKTLKKYNITLVFRGYSLRHFSPGYLIDNLFVISIHGNHLETLKKNFNSNLLPNYYGPQRFGIKKPYTHEIALETLTSHRSLYEVVESMKGLEGWWEKDLKKEIKLKNSIENNKPLKAVLELLVSSIQSYVFNKCLSKIISEKKNLEKLKGRFGILPGNRKNIMQSNIVEKDHVKCVYEELQKRGINLDMLKKQGIILKERIRPLVVRMKNYMFNYDKKTDITRISFRLPPGSYASIYLLFLFGGDPFFLQRKCLPKKPD